MSSTTIQVGIFIFITALIAFLTYLKCRAAVQSTDHSVEADNKEVFLAGGGLSWAKVFLPVYYKYECTTTTELLEKRYGDKHIRAVISILFLMGNVGIFIPAMLYGGSKFMVTMFGIA